MDGILKIIGKMEGSRQAGFYLISLSNRETTKWVSILNFMFNKIYNDC